MQEKRNAEFHIGATVFSIVGSLFILTGLMILGINYLDKFVLQLLMYALGFVVILISELLIKRLSEAFSSVISAIGLGILFVPTLSNAYIKEMFDGIIALVIAFVIGVLGIFYGKYRDSVLIRIINIIGFYSVFVVNGAMVTELKMMIVSILVLAFGIIGRIFANKRYDQVLVPVHMMINLVYLLYMSLSGAIHMILDMYIIAALIAMFVMVEVSAMLSEKNSHIVSYVFSMIASFINLLVLGIMCIRIDEDDFTVAYVLICKLMAVVLVAAVCGLVYALSNKDKLNAKIQVYLVFATILFMTIRCKNLSEALILLCGALVLSFIGRNKNYAVLDSIFSTIVGFVLLISNQSELWYIALVCLLVYLTGMFIYKYNYVYNELMSMVYVTLFSAMLTNNVMSMFTDISITEGVTFLVTTLIILYFVFITKREQHNQSFLIVIGFIIQAIVFCGVISVNAYDIFFRTEYEIEGLMISSLFIMLSAVLYIVFGFTKNKTYFRIAGLIYAGLVCLKLVLMDMHGVESVFRILAFMGEGVFALIISMIYIRFDKRIDNE